MRHRMAAVIYLTALAGLGLWLELRPNPEGQMADFVADLRARGEPVTFADVDAPMPPDKENGARDLDRAFSWLRGHLAQTDTALGEDWRLHYVGDWNFEVTEPWHEHATPEQMEDLREFLNTMGPVFDGVAKAAAKPEIAWPLPANAMDCPLFGDHDTYDSWNIVRRMLQARAIVSTSESERLQTVEWLLGCNRGVRVRTEFETRAAASYRRTGYTALRDAVEARRLDPVKLRGRIDGLLRTDGVSTMPRVLRFQRASFIEVFPSLLDGSLQVRGREAVRELTTLLDGEEPRSRTERWRDAVENSLEGIRFDGRTYVAALRDFDPLIPGEGAWSVEAEEALAAFEKRRSFFFTRSRGVLDVLRSADAAGALARVALAACEHRATHGDWPRSCADLSPLFLRGVPVNPFTNGPFDMTRDDDTLVLRALRPDGGHGGEEGRRTFGLEWRLPPR